MRKQLVSTWVTAAFAAAVIFSAPADAQRLSLAERVAKLEAQQPGQGSAQGSIELVNQINALQSQVQSLQGQIEELKHQVDDLKQRNKEQYIDLDSRINRMEGRGPAPSAAGAPPANNNGQLQDVPLGSPSGDYSAPTSGASNAPLNATAPLSAPPSAPIGAAAPPTAGPVGERANYDQAFAALKDGRYAESARRFQSFVEQYPNSDLTPNAYYWLGESYYVTQNYRISLDTFQKLLAAFPNSQKAPDALLKIGYCQYEMKQWDAAETTLNQVVLKYPDTNLAGLAQGRLRALKLEGGRR